MEKSTAEQDQSKGSGCSLTDFADLEQVSASLEGCSEMLGFPAIGGQETSKNWCKLAIMILKQSSLLSALTMQALVRLTSASKVNHSKKNTTSTGEYESKMHAAVESYRHLPLMVRAKIENWKIDSKEVVLEQCIHKSISRSEAMYKAKYKWADVTCKVTGCDLLRETSSLRRVQTELSVLAQLRHPNVVHFLGASIESSTCMLVTELLTCGSLDDVLACSPDSKQRRPPSQQQAMRWALDLARAVTYMHQSDPPVVHRDLRPANLLLSPAGAIKVSGFGSALILPSWSSLPSAEQQTGLDRPAVPSKAAQRNISRSFPIDGRWRSSLSEISFNSEDAEGGPSTTRYSAPELHGGGTCSAGLEDRGDVFSVAVVIWALFAGHIPHLDLSDAAAAAAAANPITRLRPDVREARGPRELRAALQVAWAHEAESRQTAEGLLGALEAAAAAVPAGCGGGCQAS